MGRMVTTIMTSQKRYSPYTLEVAVSKDGKPESSSATTAAGATIHGLEAGDGNLHLLDGPGRARSEDRKRWEE